MASGIKNSRIAVRVFNESTGKFETVEKRPHQLTDDEVVRMQQDHDTYLGEVEETYLKIATDYMPR